jgi:hypothetical protein
VLPLACASVEPVLPASEAQLSEPLFQDLSIRGLNYRDERVAARKADSGYGVEPVNVGGTVVRRNTKGSSVVFEAYDSDELLRTLQFALEDTGIARRIVPTSRASIDGVVLRAEPTTSLRRILWNVLNGGSLLWIAGGPFVGSVEAEVQLRVYIDGELSQKYQAIGQVNWMLSYQNPETIPQIKQRAQLEAARFAVREAVASIARNPPVDLARPLPPFPTVRCGVDKPERGAAPDSGDGAPTESSANR